MPDGAENEAQEPSTGAPGQVVLRVHRVRGEVVVAACDAELVETEVKLGQRAIKISSSFYGVTAVSAEEFLREVRRGTIVNLLGPRAVSWAESAGLIAPGGTGTLGGIPHAEIVQMP
ncbi:protein containing DUF424 [mine drainage metagenome]|uniref:Protein containing DUF424 n=1 Tax=mine drainage metagenome TaxID=410659 RepID=T1CM52_9ZZZZ